MYIKVVDGKEVQNSEDIAMLQALYSRSPNSVDDHLKSLDNKDSGKFMDKFYVGYGHESIAECGTVTIFIEGVSEMACKAIQDNPRYIGQQTSSRYVDLSMQKVVTPNLYDLGSAVNSPELTTLTEEITSKWMGCYAWAVENVMNGMMEKGEMEAKAAKAKTFDICRSLLPMGITTQLSWTTNLRTAQEKLMELMCHPLTEVRQMAEQILDELEQKYPNSIVTRRKIYHKERLAQRFTTLHDESTRFPLLRFYKLINEIDDTNVLTGVRSDIAILDAVKATGLPYFKVNSQKLDTIQLHTFLSTLKNNGYTRSRHLPLPYSWEKYGVASITYTLDLGSYRDLQRHRNGVNELPLAPPRNFVFHKWYMDQFAEWLTEEQHLLLVGWINDIYHDISKLADSNKIKPNSRENVALQYLLPFGNVIVGQVTWGLPEMVYVAELRSGRTVHPTLRRFALNLGMYLKEEFPELPLFLDVVETDYNARGNHDIQKVG